MPQPGRAGQPERLPARPAATARLVSRRQLPRGIHWPPRHALSAPAFRPSARTVNAPLVSVVLPTLNRSALLPRSIGSVLNQTHRDLELIVVDDGSSEDLKPLVESFHDNRLRYLRRDKSGGPAAARNSGVAAARGAFIAFQDSDDEWLLDKLQVQIAALQADSGRHGGVISGLLRFGQRGMQAYLDSPSGKPRTLDEAMAIRNATRYVHTQCWLIRRDVLAEAGPFDEALRLWDDWELLIRIARLKPVLLLPRPLTISYRSADSVTIVNPKWADCLRHIITKHEQALISQPDLLAGLWYAYARHLCLLRSWRAAVASVLRAIRLHPVRIKPWLLLGALAFGNEFARSRLGAAANRPAWPHSSSIG